MKTPPLCPECGVRLPAGGPPWLCPNCLLAHAADGRSEPPEAPRACGPVGGPDGAVSEEVLPRRLGGYELLERVGQGAMGIVYRARQLSLDRIVALKLLPAELLTDRAQVLRFRTEAATAGSLQHPNIVAVHEVGLAEDRPFLVMDFVEGPTLAEVVRAGPMPAERAADCLRVVAEAIHFAHERGILHRDLKPSNILVDVLGEPHIVDFGLAKRLRDESVWSVDTASLTRTGQVLGSPPYLAPEQAGGRPGRVGRRSDVYALGAILYHLLTGRPPFVGPTLTELLRQVADADPVAIRQLNPGVPRDLETLCRKCLEKDPERRYPTALALARELGRFLGGEPILTRPPGWVGRSRRWCRRQPQVAGLLAAVMAAVGLGFAGVTWQWRRAEAGQRAARRDRYVASVNAAQLALRANDLGLAAAILDREKPVDRSDTDLRGIEWRHLWWQSRSDLETVIGRLPSTIRSLEVSGDGQWLAAGSYRGGLRLWNLRTREELTLASDQEDRLKTQAAFSPDSQWLVFSDQARPLPSPRLAVWNLRARRREPSIAYPWTLAQPVFSPDGRWLAFGAVGPGLSGTMVILDFKNRNELREMPFESEYQNSYQGYDWVFTADSRSIVFAETQPRAALACWSFAEGAAPVRTPTGGEGVTAMAMRPQGGVLATGAGFTETVIRLWEVPAFRPLRQLSGHSGWVSGLKFSPDGRTLASTSVDQTVRLWSMDRPTAPPVVHRLGSEGSRVCFSPDGRQVFGGGSDGRICRWSTEAPARLPAVRVRASGAGSVVLSPDGREFAGLREGEVRLGWVDHAPEAGTLTEYGTNNTSVRFSVDGEHLLVGTRAGMIQFGFPASHEVLRRLRGPPQAVTQLELDRTGRLLLTFQESPGRGVPGPSRWTLWRLPEGEEVDSWNVAGVGLACALAPAGRRVATTDGEGSVWVRNAGESGTSRAIGLAGRAVEVCFAPDGRRLAAASDERWVRVWDVPGLRTVATFAVPGNRISGLAFSSDGRRLVVASDGRDCLRFWDTVTWRELASFEAPGHVAVRVQVVDEGGQVTAVDRIGTLLRWVVPGWEEIEGATGDISREWSRVGVTDAVASDAAP